MSELDSPAISFYDLKPGDTVLVEMDVAGNVAPDLFCHTVKRVTAHLIYVDFYSRPYYKKTGAMKGSSRYRIAPYDEKRYEDFMDNRRTEFQKRRLLNIIRGAAERMSVDELAQLAKTMGVGP